jgi:hypothetical protein
MEEYPDELRTKVAAGKPGSGRLGDLLSETASWDPAVEEIVHEAVQDATERELVSAGRRLLDERRLTEPSLIVQLVRLLADVGGLDPGQLPGAADGAAGRPPQPPDLDPLGAGLPLLGRETELGSAKDRWRDGVSVVCVTGPAGVGKTRVGREIAAILDRGEPGRPLRVRLSRGAPGTEDRRLVTTPYEALAELLTQLEVPVAEIPATLDGRRTRYEIALTNRYPVILLDGVVHENQVTPLLPPQRGCVVVTSRAPLTGLNDVSAHFVPLERLSVDWARRLVRRVFQAHGIEPDDLAVGAIARWSDGFPGPAILLARWAAVTAKATGQAPGAVIGRLEAAPCADKTAAVIGLLDPGEQAVLRALTALRLPRADQQALSLGTGLSREQIRAAMARLTELGLAGPDERDGGWVIDPLAADRVRAHASAAGQLAGVCYEQVTGPVIGLYALRARALRDLLAESAPEAGDAVRAWALRQWEAEQPGLAAVLQAAAAAPRPALALPLADAFMAVVAPAGATAGGHERGASVTAVSLIARDAGDQRLEDEALSWLEHQDQVQDAAGPGPVLAVAEPPGPPDSTVPPNALPVERVVAAEVAALPSTPVLFGVGERWS